MIRPTQPHSVLLHERRILVVEDEYLLAAEIADALSNAGAEPLGPVPTIAAALELMSAEEVIDGAVLDVNLRNEAIWPVVSALQARGVPLILATGYDASAIPHAYAHLPRHEKPLSARDLTRALALVLVAPRSSGG